MSNLHSKDEVNVWNESHDNFIGERDVGVRGHSSVDETVGNDEGEDVNKDAKGQGKVG